MKGVAGNVRKRRAYAPRVPIEERRQQLLDAALRIIARDGYAGVTIEAIAQEAGVTKPVVYGAYAKLPQLLNELLERTQNQAFAQLLELLPPGGIEPGPENPAPKITRAWMAAVRDNPAIWTPILMTGANAPQAVLDRIEVGRELVRDYLARLLVPHIGSDDAARLRADLGAQALIAASEQFGRMLLADPESIDEDVLAALFDDLTRGIARPADRSS